MEQSFKIFLKLNENTEIRYLGHCAGNNHSYTVLLRNVLVPGILLKLLEPESDSLAVLVDIENDSPYGITLLNDLIRMDDLLGPGHVRDMQQAIDSIFEFDKGSVVGQIPDNTLDNCSNREFFSDEIPGVLLDLLHAERDLLFLLLDLKDNHLCLIANRDNLVGMVDSLGPGHLGDMYETLDSRLKLDEGAVGEHVDDSSLHPASDRVLLLDIRPGALFLLFEPQRDTLFLLVDLQNLNLDLLINLDEISRMADTAPAHICDMEQAVEASQIYKSTELGDVLDHSLANLVDLDTLEKLQLLGFALLFDEPSTGNDDVHPGFIYLDDLAGHLLPDVFGDITSTTNADLGSRQEYGHANLDEKPALDLPDHLAGDLVAFLVRRDNTFPTALTISFALGECNQAIFVLNRLQEDLDLVSYSEL